MRKALAREPLLLPSTTKQICWAAPSNPCQHCQAPRRHHTPFTAHSHSQSAARSQLTAGSPLFIAHSRQPVDSSQPFTAGSPLTANTCSQPAACSQLTATAGSPLTAHSRSQPAAPVHSRQPVHSSELDRQVGVDAGLEQLGLVGAADHLDASLEDDAPFEHHLALDDELVAFDERRRAVRHQLGHGVDEFVAAVQLDVWGDAVSVGH
eukprot:scaffold2067_cov112-Isochrysis_galbana.AAC.1